jgi:hypothetical protein
MLEVLTRRYYKIRTMEEVRAFQDHGQQFVTGEYELGGKRLHLIATMGALSELAACLANVAGQAAVVADPTNLVVDLYLSSGDASADPDSVASMLAEALADVPALVIGRRVTVTVCDQTGAQLQFTFRPSQGRLEEERVIRGIHPMIGQRFDLWRLKNFKGTQLPATEDTYLFHCVALDNPADERMRRSMTPRRCGTRPARWSRSPPSSASSTPAWRASAPARLSAGPFGRSTPTASFCTSGLRSRSP